MVNSVKPWPNKAFTLGWVLAQPSTHIWWGLGPIEVQLLIGPRPNHGLTPGSADAQPSSSFIFLFPLSLLLITSYEFRTALFRDITKEYDYHLRGLKDFFLISRFFSCFFGYKMLDFSKRKGTLYEDKI